MSRSATQNRRVLERWNQTSPNVKWLMLLSALVSGSDNNECRIPLDLLDKIDNGNSLSVSFESDEVVLRYAERQETYVIQALQSWMSQPSPESQPHLVPSSAPSRNRSSVMSDSDLADYERRVTQMAEGARKVREASPWRTQPIASASR